MSLLSLAWMAFAWMLGGFVHGVTSIGCSMVAMPLISFTVEPREAIVIACLAGGIVPLMLFAVYHRHLLRRETLWLSLGCLPGIPVRAAGCHPGGKAAAVRVGLVSFEGGLHGCVSSCGVCVSSLYHKTRVDKTGKNDL